MAEILITEIVTDDINGSGAFDALMCAVDIRLQEEYRRGRITGKEYATVYLGAIQTAMAQSVQFVMGKQAADKQADLLASQITLTDEQGVQAVVQTALANKQVTLAQAQIDKALAEQALLVQKTFTEEAQTKDTVDAATVTGLIGKQKALYQQQSDGFLRNAEQRGAKVFADIWSIAKTNDDTIGTPVNAQEIKVDEVLKKVADGMQMNTTGW